jgi:hypothetical protein
MLVTHLAIYNYSEDDHMTKRKIKIMSSKAMTIIPTSVMPSKVSELVRNLVDSRSH